MGVTALFPHAPSAQYTMPWLVPKARYDPKRYKDTPCRCENAPQRDIDQLDNDNDDRCRVTTPQDTYS